MMPNDEEDDLSSHPDLNMANMRAAAEEADKLAMRCTKIMGEVHDDVLAKYGPKIADTMAMNAAAGLLAHAMALAFRASAKNRDEVPLQLLVDFTLAQIHEMINTTARKAFRNHKLVEATFEPDRETVMYAMSRLLQHAIECPLIHFATAVDENAACETCQEINVMLRGNGLVDDAHHARRKAISGGI